MVYYFNETPYISVIPNTLPVALTIPIPVHQ